MGIAIRRELIKPPPGLTGIDQLTAPALVAMLAAASVAAVDGVTTDTVVLVGLLAIPPIAASTRCSVPEMLIVGGFCVTVAALSGLWNQNLGSLEYVVGLLTVCLGCVAGLWVANLRTDLSRESDASELLADMGSLMEQHLGSQERAERVARIAVPALADAATIDLLGPTGDLVRVATVSRHTEIEAGSIALRERIPVSRTGANPVALAIETGELQVLEGLGESDYERIASDPAELELFRRAQPASALVFPLTARGSVLGALSLWLLDSRRRYDQRAQLIAKRLADRAGMALDNARLHEQEAHIAEVLQNSLRPRSLPLIEGFEVAARFMAAGEASQVGGDFYDAFRSGSRSWTIVIGDVQGKGPEAAALTALARYAVRTASGPETPPSEVLQTLHDSIVSDRAALRFCTAAVARLSTSDDGRSAAQLTIALGGHPPALALRRNGGVEAVGEPGTLLGALPSPILTDSDASLAPGESLVLYTDGLLESRDRSMADDPSWLAGELSGANGASADELAEQLSRLAIERQGGEQRDDIAVLVLQRQGPR